MNVEEFREHGKQMVDYICEYLGGIKQQRVVPNVGPGYLAKMMPEEAPQDKEEWPCIMADLDRLIMPGITHWQHPRFHAYFPSGNSYPSILGDMVSGAIGCIGFSWVASPACTELEMVMTDWLAKMMDLPKEFMHSENLGGGGVIQGSASESILVCLLAARHRTIKSLKQKSGCLQTTDNRPEEQGAISQDVRFLSKLTGYCSCLAHSSVEKNGMISFVKIRYLEVDDEYSLRGDVLDAAIQKDKEAGYVPFFVCATLGTTACCSFDRLEEIGSVCQKHGVWLHVDAAYAGSSFICPEFRYLSQGIQYVDSMNFNPNKFMLVNFDCSILWARNSSAITDSMIVDPVYLQHKHSSKAVDFRHWGIPLSRRFRSLKLWFTIRSYGVSGLQKYIRNHVKLAKEFERLVKSNGRFELVGQVTLGLVSFRLKDLNSINQCLIRAVNESGYLHMTPSVVKDKYILRFCVCSEHAKIEDVHYAWGVIVRFADQILITQSGINRWRYHLTQSNANNNQIYRIAAEKFVSTVLSSHAIQDIIRKNNRQLLIESKEEEQCSDNNYVKDSEDKIVSNGRRKRLSPLSLDDEEEEDFGSDNFGTDDDEVMENASNNPECQEDGVSLLDEDDKGVFVCENDLGVGVDKQNTMTQLRRQTLLKMISDPAVYNRRFFRSHCFCDDLGRARISSGVCCPGTLDTSADAQHGARNKCCSEVECE